MFLIFSVTFMG